MNALRFLRGAGSIVREATRHVLRHPVVGVACVPRTQDARIVLIRRSDSGQWALPGGTLEWGETFEQCARRELAEEAGVEEVAFGRLVGVYSQPERDPRFHAVTVVVETTVSLPVRPPSNPLEITEVRLFHLSELPATLSHGMSVMLTDALDGKCRFE